MRTSNTITDAENKAYDAFCLKHRIANDGTAAANKNAEAIAAYVVDQWDRDITEDTLSVALQQLRDRLTFISKEQAEVTAVLSGLTQSEKDVLSGWINRQRRLVVTNNNEGYSNIATLVSWIKAHGFAVSEHSLNNAIGNCQNSGHRKLFWNEAPHQGRALPNHVNHALTDDGKGFAPKSETNRSWRDIVNSNKPKPEAPVEAIHENFQAKADSVIGRTHSATQQARRILVTVPGSAVIDWEGTYNARLRFVSKQQPAFVRR